MGRHLALAHILPQPGLLPKEKENRFPLLENSCDWIGRTVIRKIGINQQLFPLLGERIKGGGERKTQINLGGLLNFPSVPAGLCRR